MIANLLKCAACELSKASKQRLNSFVPQSRGKGRQKQFKIRNEDLEPGQKVSIDQYQSTTPGRRVGSKGKEKNIFCGGTLFYDHSSTFIHIKHQVSLNAGETVMSKEEFERVMSGVGRKVKSYHTDNDPFQSKAFREALVSENQ